MFRFLSEKNRLIICLIAAHKIVKTRHNISHFSRYRHWLPVLRDSIPIKYNTDKIRGVLKLSDSEKNYRLSRILPSKELGIYVEQFWIVRWDLRNRDPHLQENLPHPCVHMVLEKNKSRIVGVVTRKFSYRLENTGKIFGIKFRPAGFYPFINSPVSEFSDSSLPLADLLENCDEFINKVLETEEDEIMVQYAEQFLNSRAPLQRDDNIERINQIIEKIAADRSVTKVDNLVSLFDINKRTLQRLFYIYVGINPKWVIRKYRLHEVLDKLENGCVDVQDIINELGYSDQSHFIRDFKAVVGKPPSRHMDE